MLRKKPRKKNRRRVPRALSVDEVEKIRAALKQADATLVSVLAYAGLRPGEALALKWGDVSENQLRVTRALSFGEEKNTKTGRSRTVSMLPALRWDLAAWRLASGRPSADAYVFSGRDGLPWDEGRYRRWRRFTFKPALETAGVDPDVRIYDLRHHRASMLIKSGMNLVEAAAQLGHSPVVLLATYAHIVGVPGEPIDVQADIARARAEGGGG